VRHHPPLLCPQSPNLLDTVFSPVREEAWYGRRELVEQLVERITVSRTEDGRAKEHIAYRFAPPVQVASGETNNNKCLENLSEESGTCLRGTLTDR
jgi:hypothetical protein